MFQIYIIFKPELLKWIPESVFTIRCNDALSEKFFHRTIVSSCTYQHIGLLDAFYKQSRQ